MGITRERNVGNKWNVILGTVTDFPKKKMGKENIEMQKLKTQENKKDI